MKRTLRILIFLLMTSLCNATILSMDGTNPIDDFVTVPTGNCHLFIINDIQQEYIAELRTYDTGVENITFYNIGDVVYSDPMRNVYTFYAFEQGLSFGFDLVFPETGREQIVFDNRPIDFTIIPEPATVLLLGIGLITLTRRLKWNKQLKQFQLTE